MPKYLWTATHLFNSKKNLKKHLKQDEKYFLKIIARLKEVGLISANRGIRTNGKCFSHIGILLFKNKKSFLQSKKIIDKAKWGKNIPKKNRYETYILDKEMN